MTTVKRKKIVVVSPKMIGILMKSFNVGKTTIYDALRNRSDSETARLIRHRALKEYGGVETSIIRIYDK